MAMRLYKFLTITLLLIVILSGSALAQKDQEWQEADKLTILADYATFLNPDDSSQYVEYYYCLYRNQLGFIGSDSSTTRYAGVLVTATIEDMEGNKIDSSSTYFYSQVNNLEEEQKEGIRLFDLLAVRIEPGAYRTTISVIDDVSKKTGETTVQMDIPTIRNGFQSSGIQLAYDIKTINSSENDWIGSRLEKQGRVVVPNPTGSYEKRVDDKISFYFELYGLDDVAEETQFTVEYSIKDGEGNLFHNYGKVNYDKPGHSAVISSSLDISSLEQGEYFLVFESEDLSNNRKTIAYKQFYLIDPEVQVQTIKDNDVTLMSNIAYYYLSEAEKISLGQLDNKGKVNLIRQFWRAQDDDPMTPGNSVYDEAVRRFAYAQDNFSINTERDNGWQTDRGRVYITYGPYDDRDEVTMSGKRYPYVKWTYYNLAGGAIFVFVDDFSAGLIDYNLVHSTHPREKYFPSWQRILTEGDDSEDWYDSRDK